MLSELTLDTDHSPFRKPKLFIAILLILFPFRILGPVQTGHEEDNAQDVLLDGGGQPRAGDRPQAEEEQAALQTQLRLPRGKICFRKNKRLMLVSSFLKVGLSRPLFLF